MKTLTKKLIVESLFPASLGILMVSFALSFANFIDDGSRSLGVYPFILGVIGICMFVYYVNEVDHVRAKWHQEQKDLFCSDETAKKISYSSKYMRVNKVKKNSAHALVVDSKRWVIVYEDEEDGFRVVLPTQLFYNKENVRYANYRLIEEVDAKDLDQQLT
jgi:hypothetical protein